MAFDFALGDAATTSAGAFRKDGTLVRTLWRKVAYEKGTHHAIWDGLDDEGQQAPSGEYRIKVLLHHMQYEWQGAIGNSSIDQSGTKVHSAFRGMRDMAVSGNSAFYCTGYNEGDYAFKKFDVGDNRHLLDDFSWLYSNHFGYSVKKGENVYGKSWAFAAADANWVYFAAAAGFNEASGKQDGQGFVVAYQVTDDTVASFTHGERTPSGPTADPNYPDDQGSFPYPSAVRVGMGPGLSGLAVQRKGSLLAASVAAENKVVLVHKRDGDVVRTFAAPNAGRLAMDSEENLWVASGSSVTRYEALDSSPKSSTTIGGFSNAVAVAAHPKEDIVVVADAGAHHQLRAFDHAGVALWTYGQDGGYQKNGAEVRQDKFWFYNGESDNRRDDTFLTFQEDGTLWVGDGGNYRNLHFAVTAKGLAYIDEIAWQPHAYVASADASDPTRVTNEFLEFRVDYEKPMSESWTLLYNWGAGIDPDYLLWASGLQQVTTFPNGHTYAVAWTNSPGVKLVELDREHQRLRPTGWVFDRSPTLHPDGSVTSVEANSARFYRQGPAVFDAANNPSWLSSELFAHAPEGAMDPVARCCGDGMIKAPVTSSNVVISFDQSKNDGWHLGGIRVGASDWLWKASPAVPTNVPIDGLGSYDIGDGVNYGGNYAMAVGRHVLFGYNGEFYNQGQASQHMHFYDDGLFVGQFGVDSPSLRRSGSSGTPVGFAGNDWNPSLVTCNDELYVWVNDESGHGPQRWHLAGAREVAELEGSGALGTAVALSASKAEGP